MIVVDALVSASDEPTKGRNPKAADYHGGRPYDDPPNQIPDPDGLLAHSKSDFCRVHTAVVTGLVQEPNGYE